jgi:hypothetical protein
MRHVKNKFKGDLLMAALRERFRIAGLQSQQGADGGIDYGRHVIESFLTSKNPDLPDGTSVKPNETSFREEMLGTDTSGSPHVSTHIGHSEMEIHVDRIKAEEPPGYSGEFGAPASGKKTTIYYLIDSRSSGIAGASSQVQATYRRILLE